MAENYTDLSNQEFAESGMAERVSLTKVKTPTRQNWMHPIRWIPSDAKSLLDVGCNAGELLSYCHELYPDMHLAGVEINPAAIDKARENLPGADLYAGGAEKTPFKDSSFDCATCIEVLEHIPSKMRSSVLREIHRVLCPGGRLILRVPHAGIFAFLDSNNLRFRLPIIYRTLLKQGRRDLGFKGQSEDVVWHHHFTQNELKTLLGDGWEMEASRTGGLLLFPITDIASWPFYRMGRINNRLYRALQRLADFDIGFDYGRASFDILMVLKRV